MSLAAERSSNDLLRNLLGAVRLLRVVRPKVVLTTGAGVAVPYAWIGRLLGARVVYVESLTRIERPSLSCRLIAPVASRIYAQWPELPEAVPKGPAKARQLCGLAVAVKVNEQDWRHRAFCSMNLRKQPVCPLDPIGEQLSGRPCRLIYSSTLAVPAQLPSRAALYWRPRNCFGMR
mgnify:CR=1 FL=1